MATVFFAPEFSDTPKFYREDSDFVRNDPVLAAAVPIMMSTAAQVSVGSRDFVLENGPDILSSSDEESPEEEHGEKLTGMYTHGLNAPVILSQSEVAQQRAASEQLKKIGWGKWINSDTTGSTSTTSDVSQSAPSSPAQTRSPSRFDTPDPQRIPRAQTPTGEAPSKPTVSTAVSMPPLSKESKRQTFLSDSSGVSEDEPAPAVLLSSRVVPQSEVVPPAPQRSSGSETGKGKGFRSKKATGRSAESGSSGTEHPMATRSSTKKSSGSRAGSLRGVVGSG
jgi:hypothetical protein